MKCFRCHKGWIKSSIKVSGITLAGVDVMCPDCLGNFNAVMSYVHRRVSYDSDKCKIIVTPGDHPGFPDPIESKCVDSFTVQPQA